MASHSPSKRILVVDDNQDAADMTAELLEMYGHTTSIAYGGHEGIRAAVEFVPDVVLLDLGMPVVDGFSVASTLRQMPPLDQAVLIAYTAWNDSKTRAKALACGFDMHIVKPAKIVDILSMVANAQRNNHHSS